MENPKPPRGNPKPPTNANRKRAKHGDGLERFLIIEWRHLPPPPVIEVSSDENDESDSSSDDDDDEPYGPFYDIDDVRAWVRLRRSKRVWHNVNDNGGKRIRYFEKKGRRGN